VAFIDYKKAFGSVKHATQWNTLMNMGLNEQCVGLLEHLYNEQLAAVRVEGSLTDWFSVGNGVRQGCLVLPLSFNCYSEQIMRESLG